MVPERIHTITTATYEAVDNDQEFTLSELEAVLHCLKDTAPGDDTVCYSMIKNIPLPLKHQLVIHRGETAHYMENGQDYTYSPQTTKRIAPHYFRHF